MNKLFKCISIFVIIGLLFTMFSMFCSFADDMNTQSNYKYDEIILPRVSEPIPKSPDIQVYYDEVFEYYGEDNRSDVPDYVLVSVISNFTLEASYCNVIGDYIIRSETTNIPNPMYYYIFIPSDEKLYTLKEAYDEAVDGIKEAFGYCTLLNFELVGDVNFDNKINILDVTAIQKHLSKLICIENDYIGVTEDPNSKIKYISDFNRDGVRNIKDATAIQKYIAKL